MKAYQLKISLKNSKPPIWRRCIVPAGITFSQLSAILIEIMGWSGYHLASFEFNRIKLDIIEDDGFGDMESGWDRDILDSATTYVDELMESEKWFSFTYDFGDDWSHRVDIEKVIEDYPNNYPTVLKAKGDCPPEDIGGMWGYNLYQEGGAEALLDMYGLEDDEDKKLEIQQRFEGNDYDIEYVNEELQRNYYVIYGEGENRVRGELYDDIYKGKGLRGTTNIEIIALKKSQFSIDNIFEEFEKTSQELAAQNNWNEKDSVEQIKELEKQIENNNKLIDELFYKKMKLMIRDISIRDSIGTYTKEDLMSMGEDIDIVIKKSWNKDKMIDALVGKLTDEEFFRKELYDMHQEVYELFSKIYDEGVYELFFEELDVVDELYNIGYCHITCGKYATVTSEIRALLSNIRTKEFDENRAKIKWVKQCIKYLVYYYGVIPLNEFEKVVRQNHKYKLTTKELEDIINNYIDKATIIDKLVMDVDYKDGEYNNVMRWQGAEKSYYIPSYDEVDFFDRHYAYMFSKYEVKMVEFLDKISELSNAEIAVINMQKMIYSECDIKEIIDTLEGYDIFFENESQIQQFITLLHDMYNNTRMMINKGHTPSEIVAERPHFSKGVFPTIVAGSSEMAKMLEKDREMIEDMGFKVDLESNAGKTEVFTLNSTGDVISKKERKVYPNDPCPCGSGKKYKKCCGRR